MMRSALHINGQRGAQSLCARRWYVGQTNGEQTPIQRIDEAEVIGSRASNALGQGKDVVQTPIQTQSRSAVESHARPPPSFRPSDAGLRFTFFGLLVTAPIVCYYYYEHRKQHMIDKKTQLLKEAQERYRAGATR